MAVCALMRPKSLGVTSTSRISPDLRVGLDLARFGEQNLVVHLVDALDDNQTGQRADFARLGIDVDAQVARGADAFLGGREQRIGHRFDEDLPLDPFLALEVIQGGNQFAVHKRLLGKMDKTRLRPSPERAAQR